jgi:hypothetical protein
MEDCKLDGTPFDVNSKLSKLSNEGFVNVQGKMEGVSYKVGVIYLIYAMVATRGDILFAVNTVSQFMSKAGLPH